MKRRLQLTIAVAVGGAALSGAPEAQAQTAVASDTTQPIAEIVVTAQKRASTVEVTPISITAVTGDDLQDRGMVNFTALAQSTPGVSLKSEGPGQTEVEMRGMTSSGGNSATVGFYLDDIPLTAPANAQNGKVVIDPALYDLSRVEVLRGPQGTLYGSGSMGGTVRLLTNQPDIKAFHASAASILSATEGGGFNHNDSLMLNIPLVDDKLALRVVGTENYTSGFIDRIVVNPFPLASTDGSIRGNVLAAPVAARYPNVNDEQLYGARATLLWQVNDDFTVTPSFFYQADKQNGLSAYDSVPGTLAHYQPFDVAEPDSDRITIVSLTANYKFDAFDVTSSTADWHRRSVQVQDGSDDFNNPNTGTTFASNNGLPNPGYYGPGGSGVVSGREDDPTQQFSEELRFASTGDGALNWVTGGFFSHYRSVWNFDGRSQNPFAYMDLGTYDHATTTSWFLARSPTRIMQYALFGEGTYALTDQLSVTTGLRWYKYDYKFSSVISGWGSALGAATPSDAGKVQQSSNGFNPKLNITYKFNADVMVYATAARGFRPGGGNAAYPTTGPYWSATFAPYNYTSGKWPQQYQPDSVWSYEAGEKARLFGNRVTLNTSVYYEDWKNIQLMALPGDWALNINGDHASIYGAEVEVRAVLGGGFDVSASTSYTHAYVNPGAHWQMAPANKLPDVAPVVANIGITYTTSLSDKYAFTAHIENAYVDQRYSLAFPFGYSLNGALIPLPGYDMTNVRVGIESQGGWNLSAFVNNVFNKHAQMESLFQETLPSAAFNRVITNQPLTGGIDLSYRF